jgi:hypothetical protein
MDIHGSCLCGAVAYAIATPIEEMHHCHCSRCRKHHGAAFATYAQVARAGFRFVRGAEQVKGHASSDGVARTFCGACGSNLQFVVDAVPDSLWVAVGTLDDPPRYEPEAHIFVGSKASWYAIADALPRHDGYPPVA